MKNTLLFTYSTNILVRLLTVNMNNSLTICGPILVILLKMQPHDSQSSREKFDPIQRHFSPLASYKEVPPPPGRPKTIISFE